MLFSDSERRRYLAPTPQTPEARAAEINRRRSESLKRYYQSKAGLSRRQQMADEIRSRMPRMQKASGKARTGRRMSDEHRSAISRGMKARAKTEQGRRHINRLTALRVARAKMAGGTADAARPERASD